MILIIDDDQAVQTSLALLLKQEGFKSKSVYTPEAALQLIEEHTPELVLLDMNFSIQTSGEEGLALLQKIKAINAAIPVILITGWATIALAVEGIKLGAKDFIAKPWRNDNLMQAIRTTLQLQQSPKQSLSRKKLDKQYNFDQIVGEDPAFLNILETIGRIGPTNATVLIMGESGTGKELIAEAVHQNSLRRQQPFVKVNLGGIPATLFESELFGHKRGAFTDARFDRMGRFEMANQGSIFLDEIGDMEMSNQVKLLRVLQDKTFEVLGSSRTKKVDVRVVCATNKNLEQLVSEDKFREDLFYRINLITVRLPALRERKSDIPLLVNFFVNNLKELYNRPNLTVAKKALNWLKELPLKGNIRQLKNLVERTVLVTASDTLTVADFQRQAVASPRKSSAKDLPAVGTMTLEEMEVTMIKKAMDFHSGKISKVAKTLGITRSALYRRLEKYSINYVE
ncbi:MAG: sigma-54 dependent transcriptional regulator [Bacteroidota bacterium]